jgi:hypothetical protein
VRSEPAPLAPRADPEEEDEPEEDAVDTRPPIDVSGPRCGFEYLGDWNRCEHQDDPATQLLGRGRTLAECFHECSQHEDCASVSDYRWIGLDRCYLHLSTCNAPSEKLWHEEDAARQFRKSCTAGGDDDATERALAAPGGRGLVARLGSACHYEVTEDAVDCSVGCAADEEPRGASTLVECLELCEDDPTCVAITDWWWGDASGVECLVHRSACVTRVGCDAAAPMRKYEKRCD